MVTREDVNNEARAISKIRASGGHMSIVEVLRHGWLPTFSSYYFVDMEFCDKNLDDYIQSLAQHSRLPIHLLRTVCNDEYPQPRAFFRCIMDLIFGVGMDIIGGIEFLHDLKEVHRDLKPQNGSFLERCFKS
jgi:serine/threonine protein kinase